jgi:hypothetical protein
MKQVVKYIFISILLISISIKAQNKALENEKKWDFTVSPYILFPNMNGDMTVKGIDVAVKANTSDIFSNLDFGTMLYSEAANSDWAIIFDLLYMKLKGEGETPLVGRKVSVSLEQLGASISGLYRISPWFETGIGIKINSIGSKIKIAPGDYILPGTDFSMKETWIDPAIVVRFSTKLNDTKWNLGLLADFGGFGIQSDYTWQANPFLGYQFGKVFETGVAYRWLGMKYEKGSGTDKFVYDVVTSGPEAKFIFHF